jgi:hypothetical protein
MRGTTFFLSVKKNKEIFLIEEFMRMTKRTQKKTVGGMLNTDESE